MRLDKLRHAFGNTNIAIKAEYSACRPLNITGDSFIGGIVQSSVLSLGKFRLSIDVGGQNAAWASLTLIKPFSAVPRSIAVRRISLLNELAWASLEDTDIAMIEAALELDVKTSGKFYNIDGANALIVIDKVYVEQPARRCGISEFIHANIADIVHFYSGCRPSIAVLNCGDFAEEAAKQGLSGENYKEMLFAHYEKCGYKPAFSIINSATGKYIMYRLLV